MTFRFNDFSYVILPGRFSPPEFVELYDRAFQFWHSNWTQVYRSLGTEKSPRADDFFRQDFVPVITHESRIVAIHHYSLYDLRPRCGVLHSYLHDNFTDSYFEKLRDLKIEKLMSMESLFVDPNYRKSKVGIQISEVLISLGQKVFSDLTDADAYFAPARVDNKVAETCYNLGWEPIEQNVPLNNVTVDLIIGRRGKIIPPQHDTHKMLAQYLWNNRIELTQRPLVKPVAA